jgi:response regulator RpfG family c-di-GMP phosphodiesterase
MIPKILFVDDDANLLDAIQRSLRKQFPIETAVGGAEGLRKIVNEGPFALIVADMQMPGMSGLEFLRRVQMEAPNAVRMMLTGNSDLKTAVDAVNDGRVFRFLNKPCPPPVLVPAIEAGLEQYRLERAEHDLLENTLGGAVKVLGEILSLADPATFDRSRKLKEYVHDFTASAQIVQAWELEIAAMLSQIGRVTVPPDVLQKLRDGITLLGPELDIVNQVPEIGARLLENIPRLENVAAIVRYQEKRFDGSGFPTDALAGDDIPIGARILKVLGDLIDYEARGVSRPAAFQRMQERVGWYDLKVLASVSLWCDVAIGAAAGGSDEARSMAIEDLRIGHILAQDLRTPDGLLIMAANTRFTSMLLVKLRNFRTLYSIDDSLLVRVE